MLFYVFCRLNVSVFHVNILQVPPDWDQTHDFLESQNPVLHLYFWILNCYFVFYSNCD